MKKLINPKKALGLKTAKYKKMDYPPPTAEERAIKEQKQLEKFIDDQLNLLGKA